MLEEIQLSQVGVYGGQSDKIWAIEWSPNGHTLISTCADKTIKVWRLDSNEQLSDDDVIDHEHAKTVRCISFSKSGRFLALGSFDAKISIWSYSQGAFEYVTVLEGHESEVKYVDWHPTKDQLATCSRDKTIWIWEFDENIEFQCEEVLTGHSQDVKMVKWVPGTNYQLVSASYDDTVKLWDCEDDEYFCKQTLSDHTSTIWCICFSSDGKLLMSGSEDMSVKVYTRTSEEKYAFSLNISGYHERSIYSIDYHSDTNILVSGGGDDTICVYKITEPVTEDDTMSFDLVEKKQNAHQSDVNCVKFHPRQRLLASCSDDGSIKLWKF